jgi:hypothetical protein
LLGRSGIPWSSYATGAGGITYLSGTFIATISRFALKCRLLARRLRRMIFYAGQA